MTSPRWALVALGAGLALGAGHAHAGVLDLTTALPAIATPSANVGLVAGGVAIDDFSGLSGNLLEGYLDLRFDAAALRVVSGKELALGVTRVNSLTDGDFEAGDLGAGSTVWAEHGGLVAAVSSPYLRGLAAELAVDVGSSTDAYFQQYFPTNPGDVYRLSYRLRMDDMLPAYSASGAYGTLDVRARYGSTAADAGVIHPAEPTTGYTGTALDTDAGDRYELIVRHTSASGVQSVTQLFAVADCVEHTVLDDTARHIGFTRYPSSSCDTDIQYAALTFNAEARAPSARAVALVDDVVVDWVRQVEVEILDNDAAGATGTVLQSSTDDAGFYVEPLDAVAHPYGVTVRIWLRTHQSGATPLLRHVEIRDALPVQVVVGNAAGTFSAPRLGLDMHVPPRAEFDDWSSYGADLSTRCQDPLLGTDTSCYELFAAYGLTSVRMFLDPADFDFVDDGTDYVVTPNAAGLDLLQRIVEARAAGLDPLLMLPAHGPPVSAMSFWDEACTDVLYDDVHSATPRTDAEQSRHLFTRFARAVVEGLDGTRADFGYAQVDHFEILNEPNYDAFAPYCDNFLPLDDLPLLIAEVAEELATRSTRTGFDLSFGGIEPDDGYLYDTAWLGSELLPLLDPAWFTHIAFHPYTKTWRPETIVEQVPTARMVLDNAGWTGLPLWFTEFAYKRSTYDPDCSSSLYSVQQSEWTERGYGDAEQARLMARATVSALATGAERILAWGQMSNEMVDDVVDPCWASLSDNKVMFSRVEGTGSGFGGVDPVRFVPNEAGEAWLTLAWYLSSSNPLLRLRVNVLGPADGRPRPVDERTEVHVFEIATGYAAVLYGYRMYEYGHYRPEIGERTEIAWQNLLYDHAERCTDTTLACGTRDVGWRGQRIYHLAVTGLVNGAAVDTVSVVKLDGSFVEEPLDFVWDGADTLTARGVVAGEMPVIVLLEDLR